MMIIWAFVVQFPDFDYPNATDISSQRAQSDLPGSGHNSLIGLLVQGYRGYVDRLDDWYTFYSHIALMVVLGFGLLGSFLRRYGFSSIGYSFLFAVIAFEWVILNNGLWWNVDKTSRNSQQNFDEIRLTMDVIINGMYGAATIVVTVGVLLGKLKPLELFVLTILEVIFYSFNRYICLLVLEAVDLGGSMTIHMFGAFFGLAAAVFVSRPYAVSLRNEYYGRHPDDLGSNHTSDLFALVGTIILWVFFPSFNGALAPNGTQYRSVINTILGLCSSCVIGFLVSRTFRRRLFDIRDIQGATLAGGVALGSVHNILIQPGAALLIGAVAAAASGFSMAFLQPWFERRSPLRLFDTRQVLSVHGIPGMIGGLAGIVAASVAGSRVYNEFTSLFLFHSIPSQGGYQAAAFGISLGIGVASGLVVGLLLYGLRMVTSPISTDWYSDEVEWIVPADYETKYYTPVKSVEAS